jgi:hypothetical protein
MYPFADHCGFAEASWGRDESQFSVQTLVQLLDQARTGNKPWSNAGNIELGGQERGGHKLIITTNIMTYLLRERFRKSCLQIKDCCENFICGGLKC